MQSLYDFLGKTVLITGASSGLGEQFARVFSKAGARVVLAARREEKLQKLKSELGNAKALPMDVSSKESVARGFKELEESKEKIDVVICNAGVALETPIFSSDEEDLFASVVQTNLLGVWYIVKCAANHMKKNKVPGSIITIGSINGDAVPASCGAAYSVSKAAVSHLAKTLVRDLSPHKIRINCISPGWFKTPMNGPEVEKVIPKIPYGDIAEPADLDGLILYLASNAASRYVTGSSFTIDGGISSAGESW